MAFWATSSQCCIVLSFTSTNTPPSLSPQGFFQSILWTACTNFWDNLNLAAGPCSYLVELYKGFMAPSLKLVKISLDSITFSPACQPQHTAWCHKQTCWGCSQSLPLPPVIYLVCLEHMSLKTEAKKSLNTSAFSLSQLPRFPFPSRAGPHFSLSLFCNQCTSRSFSYCPWHPWPGLILSGL